MFLFAKFKRNTSAKGSFLMKLMSLINEFNEFNFIKKEIPAQIFSSRFCEISYITLLLSDSCFCINTRSVYCPTTTFCFFKNNVTYFPAEYFVGLIYRLGTRVSSIFQTRTQTPIFNSIKHLRQSFFFENS